MVMHLKQRPFAKLQKGHTVRVQQTDHLRTVGQSANRILHPGGQIFADPDYEIGLLQGARFGGSQAVFMRAGAL